MIFRMRMQYLEITEIEQITYQRNVIELLVTFTSFYSWFMIMETRRC